MKGKILLVLALLFAFVLLNSCSDDSEKRKEAAEIVESRSTKDLLNDLYLASDSDIESLARILNATPSSIERVRKGETEATLEFSDRIKQSTLYYLQNDRSFTKLQSILDPEYGWYDSVLNFPSHHPAWFWSIFIVLFITPIFGGKLAIISSLSLLFIFIVFVIAWIASSIWGGADPMSDIYINNINPVLEQII